MHIRGAEPSAARRRGCNDRLVAQRRATRSGELRAALGDDRTASGLLATVPRRGHRFVARLADAVPSERMQPPGDTPALPSHDWFVGREAERAEIASWLVAASRFASEDQAFIDALSSEDE